MNELSSKVQAYHSWRETLQKVVSDYRDWMVSSEYSDSLIELRLYDIIDQLKKDEIILAFLAEFSRGKTETINALFFSEFKERLLPSEPGRTTMCPTEIFCDEHDTPNLKLLPIETRGTDYGISYYKTLPNAWEKFRLDGLSSEEMKDTLHKLVDVKAVTKQEAVRLGLWNPDDVSMKKELSDTGFVNIPKWRHALVNYPHPLLKNGLVVMDTPGLNTLGAEPELTLSIVPNAHAILFLVATDTGVTKSDLTIWTDYVKERNKVSFVVLNKIDTLWDELKSDEVIHNQIQRQINTTSYLLGVAPENVFAISAQKALVAKIKNNDELLAKTGIAALEEKLGSQVVEQKRELLGRTIVIECLEMMKGSRKVVYQRYNHLRQQLEELKSLRGQSLDASKVILASIVEEKKRYEKSIPAFEKADEKISHSGTKLLRHLSFSYLETAVADDRLEMSNSWTTVSLNKSMRGMMKSAVKLANHVKKESSLIRNMADGIYKTFQSQYGFEEFEVPLLDIGDFSTKMQALEEITDSFCRDPINVMTEKSFLIRRFYLGLMTQAEKIFKEAEGKCTRWVDSTLVTLKGQMTEYKKNLEERTTKLIAAKESIDALEQQILEAEKQFKQAATMNANFENMLLFLTKSADMKAKMAADILLKEHTLEAVVEAKEDRAGTLTAPFLVLDSDQTRSR